MQLRTMLPAIGLAAVLAGCYSEFPLDQAPQADLDGALLGTWRCLPAEPEVDTEPANFVFATARPRVYAVRLEAKDEEPELFEAYFSIVGGKRLLNVRDLDPRGLSKPWAFARYSFVSAHVLRLQFVQEETFKHAEQTPAGYRRVLERLSTDSPRYEEYAMCVRTKTGGRSWK